MPPPIGTASAPQAPLVAVCEVVAGDQHARLGNAELRRNDVRDALIAMAPADMRQPEIRGVLIEHFDDAADFRIGHARGAERAIDGRQIVVGHREMLLAAGATAGLRSEADRKPGTTGPR